MAIISFQSNPSDFSDDKLLSYGADTVEAINYPARIEVRGATKEGAAQMVAKGIWGPKRANAGLRLPSNAKILGLACI